MKVSIITVTYNSAATVEDTIKSVCSQDYPDIEYLLIDGGSKDKTLDIAQKYKNKISQIISEPDNGMYDAINKGIAMATGEIIAILNSDDFYMDEKVISNVVDTFKSTNSEAVYGNLFYVDALDTNKVIRKWNSGSYSGNSFLYGWMPPHPSFFAKKACYEKYGNFDLSLKSAADYELMLRFIHKHRIRLAYLNKTLVKMRIGGMSNSSLKNRINANREDRKAWAINGLKPYPFTLYLKPLRKVFQYLK